MKRPDPASREEAEVRRQVERALRCAPASAELDEERREELAASLEHMILRAATARSGVVDFPVFVADLIAGVFQAIVDASIEQMEAYADLLDEVTKSLDEFVSEASSEDEGRVRQQLLATMVLMGVNRIDVEDGVVRVCRVLDD
jgi:hypothetical protein